MATGYIVWDSKNKRFISGPFNSSADANAYIARCKVDGASGKSSKSISAQFTVETVTV